MTAPESGVELSEPRRISRTDVERARADLEWFYGDSDAAVGIRGIGFEGGGGLVWDELRIQALHLSHLEMPHRQNMRRLIAVARGVSRVTTDDAHTLSVGLSPRNWPWQSDLHAASVRSAFQARGRSMTSRVEIEGGSVTTSSPFRGVTVLGLVMLGEPLRDLYVRRHAQKDKPPLVPTGLHLLRFVEREAELGSGTLGKLRDAAEHVLAGAVDRYADAARSVRAEMGAERKARIASTVGRHERTMRGAA